MFNKRSISVLCTVLISMLIVQCKKKSGKEDLNPDASFDKQAMLINYADNIIMPAYANFKLAVDSLAVSTDSFVKAPSLHNLHALRSAFTKAYIRYQSVSSFEFGPADAELLRTSVNIFPCDTAKINSKIKNGNFDVSTVSDIDVKGFPAIDFLLFSSQKEDVVLAQYTSSENAVSAKAFLRKLVAELKHKSEVIHNGWSATGGNYSTTFKNNVGSNIGSSLALFVNQFNYDYENLKNARIGIPLGKKSLGVIYPDKVEAFYSAKSITLALNQLKSIEDIYLGRDTKGNDGLGFDDYLAALKAEHPLGQLNDVIKAKIKSINEELTKFQGENFSEMVKNNPAQFEMVYQHIFQLTVLIKVDMPSAFGVMITYEDNDGD